MSNDGGFTTKSRLAAATLIAPCGCAPVPRTPPRSVNCTTIAQLMNKSCTCATARPMYKRCSRIAHPVQIPCTHTLKHFITRPLISSSCPLCNDARHLSAGHYFTAKSHWTQLQLCEYGVTISEFKNTILQDIAVHTSACTGVNNGDC